jgi:phosphoadenosine phosphosulfate reductase
MTVVSDVIASTLEAARHPCITCSFQAEGMVVLHALRMLRPDIPVLFLDTVHHFVELYEYRDRMTNAWG